MSLPLALKNGALSLSRYLSVTAWQTLFLFALDGVTNVVDYAFHVYLGHALSPGDFAVVQTLNSTLLIAATACGVLQPVVARYVAETLAAGDGVSQGRAIFQLYFWQSVLLGLLLMLLVRQAREPVAAWLNVPAPAVTLLGYVLLLSFARPVVAGMLQGKQQFVAYGLTRTAFAVGRLVVALILVGVAGAGALGGVASLP
ncbi:MAG: hypothetical protein ACRDIB_05180, partial [Ardenticatenaceae bacterium]